MSGKRDIERIVQRQELHLKNYAKHLAQNPLKVWEDLHEIRSEHRDYFQQRLTYFERRTRSTAASDPQTPSTPFDNNRGRSHCGAWNHLDLKCPCTAGKPKRYHDKYLYFALRQTEYRCGLPGYANFIKAANLVERGCTLDAVIELFTPFTGILPRSLLSFVDFHHSKDRWKHHLNNLRIWPAHAIDPRVPQSCVLVTGLAYADEEAEDKEMDRWLLMWLREHESEAEPQLQDQYKTALLYDLAKPEDRYKFVSRVVDEKNSKRDKLSEVYVNQEEWMGKCCVKSRYETTVSECKAQRLRKCRERQSGLRYCVVSDVVESLGSEGKSGKRTRRIVSDDENDGKNDGEGSGTVGAVLDFDPGEDKETVSRSSSPRTSEEDASATEGPQRVLIHISVKYTSEEEVASTADSPHRMLDHPDLEYTRQYEG